MIQIILAYALVFVSGAIGFTLDVKDVTKAPSTFWAIGSFFGFISGILVGANL